VVHYTPKMVAKERQVFLNDDILGCSYADICVVPILSKEALFIDQEIVFLGQI